MESNKRFETKVPIYNAIQVLKTTNLKTVNKNTRNKIRKGLKNVIEEKITKENFGY